MHCHVSAAILWRKWAVVNKTLALLTVFQMNCLHHICGISLRDHVPNTASLNIPTAPYLWSLSCKAKDSDGLGHVVRMPNSRLRKIFLFGKVKGLCPSGRPRASSNDVVLRVVKSVRVGLSLLTGMHKTSCSGETRLVLHVPNMSWKAC